MEPNVVSTRNVHALENGDFTFVGLPDFMIRLLLSAY
jgi:hypothetical protein